MRISPDAPMPSFAENMMKGNASQRSSLVALATLTIIGCLYYGSYYNYYFNWADEGSVALIAERLSQGERPYVDVVIGGYGVLWYYPIAMLFKAFGANFLVVRIWFICLGFAVALFSYALLLRLTQHRLAAFLVALLVLLFPGSGYKTYIPLLVIAGAYVLLLYDAKTLEATIAPWLALAANGAYFGIAFLVRSDVAIVYAVLFCAYHGLTGLQAAIRERSPRRLLLFPARLAGVLLVAVGVALPFALHAYARGYLDGFMTQYSYFVVELISKLEARYLLPVASGAATGADTAGILLPRSSLRPLFWPQDGSRWAFLTYAPLLFLLFVLAYLCLDVVTRRLSAPGVAGFSSENAYLIALSIGAFSAFPQFFVFRPDIAHLSEFMPGLIVLCGYLLFLMRTKQGAATAFAVAWRGGYYFVGMLCMVYLVAYATRYPEGIDLRWYRPNRLQIEGRLDLQFNDWEYKVLNGLNTIIRNESAPADYVLCFPYCPGINFITGRSTFQNLLYVDDAVLVSQPNWLAETREEILAKKPKIIVIWNWDINKTTISRFSVWAAPLYRFIGDTYALKARIAKNEKDESWYEVYVLK